MNDCRIPIVSVDIPSGLSADGIPYPEAIKAIYTLTLGAPKTALINPQAAKYAGQIELLPEIGLSKEIPHSSLHWLESSDFESFYSKPPWQRIIVLISGALFNFISSVIVIAIFFMAFGDVLPRIASAGEVFADKEMTVAAEQQFQEGDIIYSVDGEKVYSLIDANAFTDAVGGKDEMSVVVIRDGEQVTLDIAKVYYADENAEGGSSYGFGISYGYTQYKLGFFPAIGHSFQFIGDVIKLIFTSIGQLFTGDAKISETLGGTVTAVSSLAQLTQFGFYAIMYGVCVLSASVAIMNILPFPALDGSKVVFTLIEWVRGKPINRKIENKIHFAGLMILFALAIVLDLVHFLG